MIELLWFLAGATAVATAFALSQRRRRPAAAPTARRPAAAATTALPEPAVAPPLAPQPPTPAPTRAADEAADAAARSTARAVAEEIATLASGIDGAAHELIECAPERVHLPRAARNLCASVHRLRTLHDKLRAFAGGDPATPGHTDLAAAVSALTDELQQLRLGIEIETRFAAGLPPVAMAPAVLHNVLLFACSAMLRSESDATHLSILAQLALGDDDAALRLELMLEWPGDPGRTPGRTRHDPRVALALAAAARLARLHGAELTLDYPPGRAVKSLLVLPAAPVAVPVEAVAVAAIAATPAGPAADLPPSSHRFGGALVVEADPAVRDMLTRELRQSGRAVFACADAAAARSFLEATPDRFELLFVDHEDRLDARDELGAAVHRLAPGLKICVLGALHSCAAAHWPAARCIQKPFGPHELRRALASVLDAG